MNPHANPNDGRPAAGTPSDEDLLDYLLGSASGETRSSVERWLAADASHGERLSSWAPIVLIAAQAVCDLRSAQSESAQCKTPVSQATGAWRSRRYRLAGLLTLAASILVAVFALDGFRDQTTSDGRIAMAWAEALPVKSEAVVESELSNWLFEPGGSLDASEVAAFDDFSGEDEGGSAAAFGFTEEPPEWLLAAVSEMQSGDRKSETGEDTL